jgi:hypothetical protein
MMTVSEKIAHHREQYCRAMNGGSLAAWTLAPYHMFWLNHYINVRIHGH